MKRFACSLFLLTMTAALAACGGDDPPADDDPQPDADVNADLVEVDCDTTTVAEIITTSGFAYSPMSVTINVGESVRFSPTSGHDVAGDGNAIDVPIAGEGCYRFNTAGTYDFFCTPHGFTGSVVVEP